MEYRQQQAELQQHFPGKTEEGTHHSGARPSQRLRVLWNKLRGHHQGAINTFLQLITDENLIKCFLKTFFIQIALNSKAGGVATFVAAFVRKPKKGQPSNAGRFSGGVNKVLVRDQNISKRLNIETFSTFNAGSSQWRASGGHRQWRGHHCRDG